jgi:hypothetical protein
MNNDSIIALAFTAMIVMLFGVTLAAAGYRLFMVLLPIFGYFFGFVLGAQAIQAIFGTAFLATVTGWVVGFVVGLVFAVLSYLFYFAGVAILAGAIGYALGTGLMQLFGLDLSLIEWIVGMVVGLIFAVGTLVLNIQKWVLIFGSALIGAGIIVTSFLVLFGSAPPAALTTNPVKVALNSGPFWVILYLLIAAFGAAVQFSAGRGQEVQEYNRLNEVAPTV